MNLADLFAEPRTDASRRLKELATRHNELRAEARGLHEQSAATAAEKDESARELREAEARQHAFGDAAPRIKTAKARLSKLEQVAAERADAARIVRDAAEQVDAELRRHAAEHATPLWVELTKDNRGAAERLTKAVAAMVEALADYRQAGVRATELMRLVDPEAMRTTRVPEPPDELVQFAKAAKVAARSIRVPVPEIPGQGPVVRLAEQPDQAISA